LTKGTTLAIALAMVPLHSTNGQTTVTLTPSADTTMFEALIGDELSSGVGTTMYMGQTTRNNERRRALMRFDLSSIPASARVTAVSLRVNQTRAVEQSEGDFVAFHRVTRTWGEGVSNSPLGSGAPAEPGDASWTFVNFPTTQWTTAGGDFAEPPSYAQASPRALGFITFAGAGLTADVQGWIASPATNFGWILRGEEVVNGGARRFNTRETSNTNNRPRLTVTYTLVTPCGPSDVAGAGQSVGADGEVTADDIIAFVAWFVAGDARADIAGSGPVPGADGQFTADDIILFISRFTLGC
jgi:hypothetical protein